MRMNFHFFLEEGETILATVPLKIFFNNLIKTFFIK